jgi:cellulose synthase/poly-beta-1,6-N-acetylglucosamine synthase-like glycosyltransferase
MRFVFWTSVCAILYTYIGYPLCLAFLRRCCYRPVNKGPWHPHVSVVLAARDEEENIQGRLDNLLAQDYPADKLEIVVVSDGSRDRTVELVRQHGGQRLKVVELEQSGGKAAALNAGVLQASGEIVIFCDARQRFEPGVVRELAANFHDPQIGAVSGELVLAQGGSSAIREEMGAYWRYETWIRRTESATGSVIGATGAIYAIRRALFHPLPPGSILDDVIIPMHVVLQGRRTIFDDSARAQDIVSKDLSQEWVRKVRTLAGNWQLLRLFPELLFPWRNPCCWRFVSHKVMRLLVPAALGAMLATGALVEEPFYQAVTMLQLFFYVLALTGAAIPASRSNRIVKLSYFFLVMNAVPVAGFWCWLSGRSGSVWRPAYKKVV